MSARATRAAAPSPVLRDLEDENRTLYGVIKLVSSSLEVQPMLQGVVGLATEATGCHACFIYLLEHSTLTMRAASPVFADAVGKVKIGLHEGLTGWVARHRTPEFIREGAMQDPRMKFISLLQEERFQSMVAVPILSRAEQTIGVIVLHTEAPHEFTEDTLKLLVHIASLVSGAIENAQLYDQQRRRVDSLTNLSELAQDVAGATDAESLAQTVVRGAFGLLGATVCQLYRPDAAAANWEVVAAWPPGQAVLATVSAAELMHAVLDRRRSRKGAPALWPGLQIGDLLVTPLSVGDERVGLLCAGAPSGRRFSEEDTEVARAIAHLAAIAFKRLELIEGLTNATIVKDLFEALAAGAGAFAAAKASEVRCDLAQPYVILCAEPLSDREHASPEWRETAELIGHELAQLAPRSAIQTGPGPLRALLALGPRRAAQFGELVQRCRELGRSAGAAIGVSEIHAAPADATRALHEAVDASLIGRALIADGGAIGWAELGAYRYLVHIAADDAPQDRMRAAVDQLIAYDGRRRTALLDTLERYLTERRSVVESARALYIHPNTLRQRLGRIEELTGLDLDRDDLLSLELAIKLARLHRRPAAGAQQPV